MFLEEVCCGRLLRIFLILLPGVLSAQISQDSLQLPEVEISGSAKDFQGLKTIKTDSLALEINRNNTLSELLSRSTAVFVKSYGPGALALPGFRGTAASHTKLYWNGLPLTSPLLGVADLNLVPVFALDEVEVQYGNASMQQGSGGFGGNIVMNSFENRRNILQANLMQNFGSFGLHQTQFKALYGKKIMASTRVFYRQSKNNFSFLNTAKFHKPDEKPPTEIQQHAGYKQYGFLQTVDGKLKDNLWFAAAVWHQFSNKELPPLMISANNQEQQKDESTRATFQLKKYSRTASYYLDAGYSNERLNYDNIVADIYSQSIFQRYYIYPHLHWQKYKNLALDAGLQAMADEATSPKYKSKNQQRISLPLSVQYTFKKRFQISFLLRPETVNFQYTTLPFLVNGNYSLLPAQKLEIYANAGKNYNYPTLNDLYWYPGGNPGLLPENAISAETGLNSKIKINKAEWSNSLSVFSTNIDNYIQWQPGSQGFWMPQNLRKVWTRGMEITSKIALKLNKSIFSLTTGYSFVRSTNLRALNDLDKSVGRQLIYVPAQTAQISAFYGRGKSIFSAQYIYTHFRYTPTSFLPAYNIINLQAETGVNIKKTEFRAFAKCNNLLNTSYQAIEWRPMPGRWYELGLAIKFTTKIP